RSLSTDDGSLACRRDKCRAAFRRTLPDVRRIVTKQNRAPPFDEPAMLLLDHSGVPCESPPDFEVLTLDDALCAGDFPSDDRALDGCVSLLWKESRRNQIVDAVSHEQLVLETDEESTLARISLTPCTSPELQVHAPALV